MGFLAFYILRDTLIPWLSVENISDMNKMSLDLILSCTEFQDVSPQAVFADMASLTNTSTLCSPPGTVIQTSRSFCFH